MDERLINIVKHYDNDAQIRQLIEVCHPADETAQHQNRGEHEPHYD